MDNKTLATIFFRVTGISYLLFSLFYAPYILLYASYSGTFILSSLSILTYLLPAIGLLLMGKPLGALVAKGLDRNVIQPPSPPQFESELTR